MNYQVEVVCTGIRPALSCIVSADAVNPHYDIAPLAFDGPLAEWVIDVLSSSTQHGPQGFSYQYPQLPLGAVLLAFAREHMFSARIIGKTWPSMASGDLL